METEGKVDIDVTSDGKSENVLANDEESDEKNDVRPPRQFAYSERI